MRISTLSIYDLSVSSMHRQQNDFLKVGQQIASGRRVVKPSDDPQAASRAVGVSQAQSITNQYTDARISARNALSQEESVLNSISTAITRAKTLLVQASSDTLSDVDRNSVATELKGVLATVLGQANATDGNGHYLFGGFRDDSDPFLTDPVTGAVSYVGDTNTRELLIDASRKMPVVDHGAQVFQSVPSSAGYVAEADAGNGGTLIFKGPHVVDATDADYGRGFQVSFAVAADGSVEYTVSVQEPDLSWTVLQADVPWEENDAISFGGVSLGLEGLPADGDIVHVDRASREGTNANTDLFVTLNKAISALENAVNDDAGKAARRNTINSAMRELDNSLDNILTVRASVGARLNELDTVDAVADLRILNYEQTLSDLVNLDYVEAASEYARRQVGLMAAQKTFADISKLSLFDHF